ncbi:hypothetical protein DQ04_01951030 [Trypanosoma grayi]|uniref:hypothetical protein n=1 Tax=Trypanosoma grayi TaxID=71804 RepID=UPI0004F47C17|nr:hypothetical protein DQ04_01951030 [Trypanosoma grayi]KEG12148.1 hypothetical protein DQ04_01951030 [Trypanosoma grayi]
MVVAAACSPETVVSGMRGPSSSLAKRVFCDASSSSPAVVTTTAVGGAAASAVDYASSCKRPPLRPSDALSSNNNSAVNDNEEMMGTAMDEKTSLPAEDDDDVDDGGDETDEQRFFRQHENLSSSEWRPWFEQFCTMLVESSDHVCVSSCSPLVRRHFTIFSSELLPIAFLSHLTKCDDKTVRRWMQLLCDFVRMHNRVPQIIAAELARLAHHIRLYSPSLFSLSLLQAIEDEYITLELVTVLAERALNTPLMLLYLEQQLLCTFTWEALARVVVALEDVNYFNDPRFLSHHPLVRRAAHRMCQASTPGMRRESTSSTKNANSITNNTGVEGANATGEPDFIAGPATRAAACDELLPWEVQRGNDDRGDNNNNNSISASHHSSSSSYALLAAQGTVPSGGGEYRWRPALLESCWFEAASREYLHSIRATLHGPSGDPHGASLTWTKQPLLSPSSVVGAMRCYMRVYDFESILNLWMAIKDAQFVNEETATPSVGEEGCEQQLQRILLGTAWAPSTGPMFSHITRYVVSAAKALSRWNIVDEINFEHVLPTDRSTGECHLRNHRDFPFYNQVEIFRAAALTASKEYGKAKEVLADLRTALKDAYAVFHTENTRLKFELSIMFQQISDLEEGIDAIELKWAMGTGMSEAGATSSSSGGGGLGGGAVVGTAANPAAGGVLPSAEGGKGEGGVQATSVAGGRDGAEAHQGNRSRGAAYTEATRRRLQNIAGRPLPAHSTALQRFETIALRSALVSPDWQLQNILVVCEQIAQEGMPRRAVRTIDHFFSLPIDSSDLRADRQYRDTLLLEKYRLELQHLHRTCELARLQSEITEELMQKCKNYMTGEPGLIHMGEAGEVSFAGFVGTGPISEQHAELLLLHVECERKLSCIHQRRRKLSAAPQPILVPYLDACSGTPSQGVAAGREPFRSPSSSSTAAAASGAIAHNIEEEERPADVLLREYRLMEHIIGSSSIIASIWREFGLLLFDVCMAIYAEWDSTREPETLNNFCVQSEKAISALQKSVQFWSSAAFTSITGIGPFSSTVSRRLRHTRSALPAVHLLLKSLHLALKLEEIDTDGASKDQSEGSGRRTITGHNEEWGRGAGFAQLDFSPAMYVHWGGILPLLVNAAARHIKLHDAVREMCVQSRAMLYQCVFHLVSTFEHRYGSALEHDAGFQGQKLHREESYPGDPHSLSSGPVLVAASSALAPVEELPGDEVTRRAGSRHHTTVAAPTVVATSAGSTSPAQGGPERRQTIEGMQRPKDASRQWRSSMLTNLAEIDAEYKAIVCQTMQLCEFVRSGTEASLTLGMCALPAPTWFLQRHIVAIDGDEAQQQKSKASKTNNSATATDSTKWSEQDHEARTTCNELQRVLHVRRQLNPTSPHYCREEVFLFFLSDGSVLRFHSIEMQENTTTRVVAPSPRTGENRELYRRSSEAFTAPTPVPAPTAVHMTSFTTARINDVTPCGEASNTSLAAAGGDKTAFHTELPDTMPYIRPLAAMESSVCYLLAHLPLQFTRRPLVLPITVQTFITQLPDLPTHSSSWQVTLPPSLQFNYTASMWRQPSSIFHILSDFRLRYREEGNTAPQWHQQPQKQQRMTTDPHDITFMHAASSQTVLSGRELDTVNVASASRSQRIRRRLTEKYERLLEFAFDHGQTRPLCAFLHQVTLSKKLSEVDYPRPSSQLQALQTEIEEVLKRCQRPAEETHAAPERGGRKRATTTSTPDGENEEGFLNEEHSPISAQPRKRRYDASPQQLQESLLTSLRLVILKSEAPRYATALQLAFRGASADAANWLEAVHLYTHELAEWSMLQYLFDTIRREATTFFVDVNSGHVASHHLGVNALQPLPYSARARRMSSSSVGGCGAVSDEPPEKTMSVGPPFPCTDPTAFRLTGCLVSPLPLGCPYGVFLGSATQCLYSVLLYRRDVAGIVKFGLEDMTCFAWRAVTPPHQSPLDGLDAESALKSGSVTILPDSSNREVSRLTAAATGSAGGGSVLLHPFEVSATACAMTTPLGEAPATPAADGAARTSESPCALMDRSGVSSPLRSAQNAVAVPNCAGTSESMEHSPKPERADGEGRLQSASALAAAAAAPAEATSSMRRMSFSAVNTAAFDTWGKRMNPPHRRMNPPRLFDGASIIMKLTDDQLPMRDEPILQPFGQPSMEHSGDLIHIYTSGTNSSVNPGTPFKSTCKTAQSPLKGMGGETAAAAGLSECTSARTVEERVTQLIRVSMDPENLVGTIDVPHRWNLWAPHW